MRNLALALDHRGNDEEPIDCDGKSSETEEDAKVQSWVNVMFGPTCFISSQTLST